MIKSFFKFSFIDLVGIALGLYLFSAQSETRALHTFLTQPYIYVINFLIVFLVHFISWIVLDKATFYNMGVAVKSVIVDFIVLNAVMLGTVGSIFLITTFLL